MRLSSTVAKAFAALLGAIALTAATGAATAMASTSPTAADAALKRTAESWVHWASGGNAQKACLRQTEQSVDGLPCSELPNYFQVLYCPAFVGGADEPAPDQSWRTPAETVVKARAHGSTGSAVFRSTQKASKVSARASFAKVAGEWRIASLQRKTTVLAPAGLVFTDGAELREQLWPAHC